MRLTNQHTSTENSHFAYSRVLSTPYRASRGTAAPTPLQSGMKNVAVVVVFRCEVCSLEGSAGRAQPDQALHKKSPQKNPGRHRPAGRQHKAVWLAAAHRGGQRLRGHHRPRAAGSGTTAGPPACARGGGERPDFGLAEDSPSFYRSFNGAAIIRSRKYTSLGLQALDIYEASMGPRSFDRGNLAPIRPRGTRHQGFNGAAIIRSRKYPFSGEIPCSAESFNGAAIIRSRKCLHCLPAPASNGLLQWGRDHSIAEITGSLACPSRSSRCFNGAAIIRSRKSSLTFPVRMTVERLQWGRDHSIAEILCDCFKNDEMVCFNGAAIIRSRKFGQAI